MFEFIETKRHTVESVYGRPEAEILAKIDAKHEAVEFRRATDGDKYLTVYDHEIVQVPPFAPLDKGPRLILRRKTVKRRVLTETGEVRYPLDGDWYEDSYSRVVQAKPGGGAYAYKYPIYRETFIEVEA